MVHHRGGGNGRIGGAMPRFPSSAEKGTFDRRELNLEGCPWGSQQGQYTRGSSCVCTVIHVCRWAGFRLRSASATPHMISHCTVLLGYKPQGGPRCDHISLSFDQSGCRPVCPQWTKHVRRPCGATQLQCHCMHVTGRRRRCEFVSMGSVCGSRCEGNR